MEKEGPFAQRLAQNAEAKRKLARAACRLFQPGDSLFIDTGSTTVALAEALADLDGLVVVTNAPRIVVTLAANPSHSLFLIGGAYGADAGESLGPLALEQIGKFRVRHAVLTIGALDTQSVMDFDLQEAEVAKAMIERADRITVLVDHSKFDRRAVFEVAPLSRIDTLVTDKPPSEAMGRALAAAGVEVILPGCPPSPLGPTRAERFAGPLPCSHTSGPFWRLKTRERASCGRFSPFQGKQLDSLSDSNP
nr:DeoR/GlpR family DNA-binding transcription regulator [Allorhizobium borbori]